MPKVFKLSSHNINLKVIVLDCPFVKNGKRRLYMTDIREVLAANLKKYRQARGWSQAKLAEKVGTSTQYIGTLETRGKFPSSQMVHRLATALGVDPTALFYREPDPYGMMRNLRKVAVEDIGEEVSRLVVDFFAEKARKLEGESGT